MPADPPAPLVESEVRPGGVLALRLVPERAPLDEALLNRFAEACADGTGTSVRVVVLEGGTDGIFASGPMTSDETIPLAWARRLAVEAWASLEATTVAVVRGACLGTANDLLLGADLVIAFPSASFAWADPALEAFGRRLPAAALLELFGRGDAIATERAIANGLVDLVVRSEDELDARIASLAGEEGEAFRRIKRVARESRR